MPAFAVSADGFTLDGAPFQVLAGSLHYFRVHSEQWRDRIRMVQALGLNAIDTYVPWNLHETHRGRFDFTGIADVERFLREVSDAGMYTLLRPGPYICSEWDNGGLPAWLGADTDIRVRCSDERFLAAVDSWLDELVPRILDHQVSRGGSIIAVQIENDFARYGTDEAYIAHLRDALLARGIDVPLYTCEAPAQLGKAILGPSDVFPTVYFEKAPDEAAAALRAVAPGVPMLTSELICSPIQGWDGRRLVRDIDHDAEILEWHMATGASFSLYMAHGGTNFGLWAGAELRGTTFIPAVTSYDSDAPIDERGQPTDKFWRFREVMSRHVTLPSMERSASATPTLPSGVVVLGDPVRLVDALPKVSTGPLRHACPPTFEELDLASGLALYRTSLRTTGSGAEPLTLRDLRDRAQVFLDGAGVAVLDRNGETSVDVEAKQDGAVLDVLVESMGRVNFGPSLGERKGIVGGVSHGAGFVHDWAVFPISLDDVSKVPWDRSESAGYGPVFLRGALSVDTTPLDAFLAVPNGAKGFVWVNGFCVGRYWDRGPQETLYVPAPVLRAGENDVVVLELHPDPVTPTAVEVRAEHSLGTPTPWDPVRDSAYAASW